MNWERTDKGSDSSRETETVVQNICSYQVPEMVWTNNSTNENHNFYNSTVQAILRGVGDCATKFGSLCANFIDMGPPVKNQVEIEFSKLFYFQGQKIGVSDESFCTLKDSNLCDKEGKVINISDPLGKTQRQLSHFLSFMMTVDTDQADPKFKCSRMTCSAFFSSHYIHVG